MQLKLSRKPVLIILALLIVTLVASLVFFLLSINRPSTSDRKKGKGFEYLFSIYGFGQKIDELLSQPNGIAVGKNRYVYVTDQDNNRIVVFDKDGKFLFKFGKKGGGRGAFQAPMGIAVSPKGLVYVTDRLQGKVLIFDLKGKFIKEFKVDAPLMPAVTSDKLYITTSGHVMIYDLEGKLLAKWGKKGRQKGEFDFPNGIAVGEDGTVFVADSNNFRIQALDPKGKVLWAAGGPTSDPKGEKRRFGLPVSLSIDEDGVLYLVDAFPGSIRVLSSNGVEFAELGEYGRDDGQLNHPAQMTYGGNRIFYIADKFNDRVQAIKIPSYAQE